MHYTYTATYTCVDCRGNSWEETKSKTVTTKPKWGKRPLFPQSYPYTIQIPCSSPNA